MEAISDRIDLLKEVAFNGIESNRMGFTKPDDDWFPVAIIDNGEGHLVAGLSGDPAELVEQAMVEHDAVAAALVASTWYAVQEPDAGELIRPRDLPDDDPRKLECLTVCVVSEAGIEYHSAKINRHPDSPPTLDEWQEFSDGGIEGRIVDAMKGALVRSKVRRGQI